jgi:diphthine-ammonia ligase
MQYVALLSGGKDSCYNLLHCAQNGHQLVAAASLRPEAGKGPTAPWQVSVETWYDYAWSAFAEELDSYMYQTVGQDAIHLIAQALDVPLYRQTITGSALEMGSEYGGRDAASAGGVEGDETEDLYRLLEAVKACFEPIESSQENRAKLIIQANHPNIQGVSVGAILSNYQRVRVEHV